MCSRSSKTSPAKLLDELPSVLALQDVQRLGQHVLDEPLLLPGEAGEELVGGGQEVEAGVDQDTGALRLS